MKLSLHLLCGLIVVFLSATCSLAQVRAGFTGTDRTGCAPLITHFSNTSTGTSLRYHWVFNESNPADTSNLTSPTWIYTATGTYLVKLYVYDGSGHSDSLIAAGFVNVLSPPHIDFIASDTFVNCPPSLINFRNLSDTSICGQSYTWYIDTAVLYTRDASYNFTVPGRYDIGLRITDTCGCVAYLSKPSYVNVLPLADPCFRTSDTDICYYPATVCFENCTSGSAEFLWKFGDGTQDTTRNPCHVYNTPGRFSDTLISHSSSGCIDTIIKPNYVRLFNNYINLTVTPSSPCIGTRVFCSDTVDAHVHHEWHFSISGFDTSSTADRPIFNCDSAGDYSLTDHITIDSGCSFTLSRTVSVRTGYDLNIEVDHYYACSVPIPIRFHATTSDPVPIVSYLWRFGDASISRIDTPTHTYTRTGFYSPSLVVIDSLGCRDSVTKLGLVEVDTSFSRHPNKPEIMSSKHNGCYPFNFKWQTFFYRVYRGRLDSFMTIDSIEYGDTTVGYSLAPDTGSHTYNFPGVYVFTMHYHLYGGCTGTAVDTIKVGEHPIYTMWHASDTTCPRTPNLHTIVCSNCSVPPFWLKAPIDTLPHSVDSAYFRFAQNGFQAVPVLLENYGCLDTGRISTYILRPPTAFTSRVPNCNDRKTILFNIDTSATFVKWKFGDGDSSIVHSPTHTYTDDGEYTITMFDSSARTGCVNWGGAIINIQPFVHPMIVSDSSVCPNTWVNFDVLSGGSNVTLDFGDGNVLSDEPYNDHITYRWAWSNFYTTPGRYHVSMITTNWWGCRDTTHGTVLVEQPGGGLRATPILGCNPLTVHFTDSNSYLTTVPIATRTWQFASGGPIIGALRGDTSVTFPEGNYTITMHDIDTNGCEAYDVIGVSSVQPHAWFQTVYIQGCSGHAIPFHDTNTHVTYKWFFGDGSPPAYGQNVGHTYTRNGVYTDTVIITTIAGGGYPAGCIDTLVRRNYVTISDTSIIANFSVSDTFVPCPPAFITAINHSTGAGVNYYMWKYGLDSTTINYRLTNSTPYYDYPGAYTVTLIDSNAIGCKDSIKKSVHIGGPTGIISFTPDTLCQYGEIHFHLINTSSHPLDSVYNWSLPPYGAFRTDTPGITFRYNTPGTYSPFVVIDSSGCQVAIHTRDSFKVYPHAVVTVTHPPLSCSPSSDITATGGISYHWFPAATLSCDTCATTNAHPRDSATYVVIGTDIHGCRDSATTFVVIDPPRHLHLTGRVNACIGDCDTIAISGAIGATYTWHGPSLNCYVCPAVVACPTVSTNYTVTSVDTFGCVDTAYFGLAIRPLPNIVLNPTLPVICKDQYLNVSVVGGTSYSWRPNAYITCDTCGNTSLLGVDNLFYTVTATTAYGCHDSEIYPVTVIKPHPTSAGTDTAICPGQSVQLWAMGGLGGYFWSPGKGLSDKYIARPFASPDSTTIYRVIIKENICFLDTAYVKVVVEQFPSVVISPDITVMAGSQVQLHAYAASNTPVNEFTWSPASTLTCEHCPNPVATPTATTTYVLTSTTKHGCATDTSITVTLFCDKSEVFIPNSFTPNNDGLNDAFYVSGSGLGLIKKMTVYSRWGEEIFSRSNIQPNDPSQGWDGTFKGTMMPPDNFIYIIEVECELGNLFHYQGDISIVR